MPCSLKGNHCSILECTVKGAWFGMSIHVKNIHTITRHSLDRYQEIGYRMGSYKIKREMSTHPRGEHSWERENSSHDMPLRALRAAFWVASDLFFPTPFPSILPPDFTTYEKRGEWGRPSRCSQTGTGRFCFCKYSCRLFIVGIG